MEFGLIDTVAVAGVPTTAPLGCDNATLKVTGLLIAVALTGTTIALAAASPTAQLKLPDCGM